MVAIEKTGLVLLALAGFSAAFSRQSQRSDGQSLGPVPAGKLTRSLYSSTSLPGDELLVARSNNGGWPIEKRQNPLQIWKATQAIKKFAKKRKPKRKAESVNRKPKRKAESANRKSKPSRRDIIKMVEKRQNAIQVWKATQAIKEFAKNHKPKHKAGPKKPRRRDIMQMVEKRQNAIQVWKATQAIKEFAKNHKPKHKAGPKKPRRRDIMQMVEKP